MGKVRGSLPLKIRSLRAEKGWTQQEAADRIGITRDSLSRLEHGLRQPHAQTIGQIATAYGVSAEDLLALEDGGRVPEGELVGPKAEAPEVRREELEEWESLIEWMVVQLRSHLEAFRASRPDAAEDPRLHAQGLAGLLTLATFAFEGGERFVTKELVPGNWHEGTDTPSVALDRVLRALEQLREVAGEISEAYDALPGGELPETAPTYEAEVILLDRFRKAG